MPRYLLGGTKGKKLQDNLSLHLGAEVLVTIDIKDFYPSVSHKQVFKVWREVLDCSEEVSSILTRLTTRERHLPQGASTSTAVANLVLFSIDSRIRQLATEAGVCYSSWVDDLAFSGKEAVSLIPTVVSVLSSAGFAIGRRKLRIMRSGSQKVLHGILINKHPKLLPERYSELRSAIHKLKVGQISLSLQKSYIDSLSGAIGTINGISPNQGRKLQHEFDAALIALQMNRYSAC